IRLQVTGGKDQVSVSVSDNGIGIAPAMLDRVFDMFSQARKSGESQGGLGIGLTLVKGLVTLHHGDVRASSNGEGQGSEFVITLPAMRAASYAPVPQVAQGAAEVARPLRILVADDNVDSAMSWSLLMEGSGHQVVTAHDGLAAVEAAEKFRPQIALLDVGM